MITEAPLIGNWNSHESLTLVAIARCERLLFMCCVLTVTFLLKEGSIVVFYSISLKTQLG